MGIFDSVKKFLTTEIKEENEPKETAVLIRVLCLVDVLFMLINSVFLFLETSFPCAIVGVLLVLLVVLILLFSYKSKMSSLVLTYYIVILISALFFTLCIGVGPMYHIQLFIIFLLFFYRSAQSSTSRVIAVLVSGIAALSAIFHVTEMGAFFKISDASMAALIIANTVYILIKVTIFAYFFMYKYSASELKIMQYSRKLEMIATTDPLTKLQNRRGMMNHIDHYLTDQRTEGRMLTIAIGDIDFFKKINDTYGHEAGDYVLETLAKIMNEFMEGKGTVARWGGEEFLFSFENINGDYAFEHMSKLLHLIERYVFTYDGTDLNVTMTFGIEEYDSNEGLDKTISKADEKLYMGKSQGRDRVIY